MTLKVLVHLEHDGVQYETGSVIPTKNIPKKDLERLINLKVVETTNEAVSVEVAEADNFPVDDTPSLQGAEDFMSDEEVYNDIDDGFGHTELKREAKEIGMDFPGNISKKDLIQLIIDQEQDDHFLDLLENR